MFVFNHNTFIENHDLWSNAYPTKADIKGGLIRKTQLLSRSQCRRKTVAGHGQCL